MDLLCGPVGWAERVPQLKEDVRSARIRLINIVESILSEKERDERSEEERIRTRFQAGGR